MAYTEERLLQAQRLFDRSTSQFSMLPYLAGPYYLRERASKRAAILASWHDNDNDADYEPPGKRTPSKRKVSIFHGAERDPRPSKRARSFSPVRPSSSKFRPESDVKHSDLSSTPSPHSEPDSWDRYWAVDPETVNQDSGYSLRRRNKETIPTPSQQNNETGPNEVAPKLTGNGLSANDESQLRQCSACQDLGLECSLVSDPDEFAYPCTACALDKVPCIVSPAPKWKRPCESCKVRRREVCSYRYANYDHTQPCQPCINHGFTCVAGPVKYPLSEPYMSDSRDPSTPSKLISSPTSSPPQCTPHPATAEGQKPSHPSNPPDINASVASTSVCDTAVPLYPDEASNSTKLFNTLDVTTEPLTAQATQPSNSPNCYGIPSGKNPTLVEQTIPDEVILIDSDDETSIYISDSPPASRISFSAHENPPSETVYRLWTSLVHPVEFLAEVPQDGSRPCHWCNNFAYGIIGLGGRHTEIFEYPDGTKIELADGHSDENKEQSRMCVPCTWDRVKILQCSHSSFTPLPSSPSTEGQAQRAAALANLAQAKEALIDTGTGETGPPFPSSNHKWCSLCEELALTSCQTLQPVNVYAEVVDCDEEKYGCGLILCGHCHDLANRFQGDLRSVVTWGRRHKISFRADVDYLLPGAEHNTIYKFYMNN